MGHVKLVQEFLQLVLLCSLFTSSRPCEVLASFFQERAVSLAGSHLSTYGAVPVSLCATVTALRVLWLHAARSDLVGTFFVCLFRNKKKKGCAICERLHNIHSSVQDRLWLDVLSRWQWQRSVLLVCVFACFCDEEYLLILSLCSGFAAFETE